jgi:hypothetical protein
VFEQDLKDRIQRIFKVKKVSFDEPGETQEQECIFLSIEDSKNSVSNGIFKAMVTGSAVLYSTSEKLPFGFMSKAIDSADPEDTKPFYFFDFEANTKIFRDKVQRGFSFVYFFNSQYDPEKGTITSVEFTEEPSQ